MLGPNVHVVLGESLELASHDVDANDKVVNVSKRERAVLGESRLVGVEPMRQLRPVQGRMHVVRNVVTTSMRTPCGHGVGAHPSLYVSLFIDVLMILYVRFHELVWSLGLIKMC